MNNIIRLNPPKAECLECGAGFYSSEQMIQHYFEWHRGFTKEKSSVLAGIKEKK